MEIRGVKVKNNKSLKSQEIRNTLGAKKSFFSLSDGMKEILEIVLTVAVSFVGTYLFLPWHGTISAIPIVIISALLCAQFKTNEIFKAAVFFVSPFSVSLLVGTGVYESLVFGISCFAFYILASLSVSLFKKEKSYFKIVSVFTLIISIGLHCFLNSTPWDVYKSKNAMLDYVKDSYAGEPLYASSVKFNTWDRTYSLSLFPHHDMGQSLNVVLKDGKIIEDEYVEYAEKYNMIVGAGQITYVIRKMYPDLKFSVERNRIHGYPFLSSASIEPKADYSKYMDFSVYFPSYNDIFEFSELSENCYRALITSGFYCRNITFYGGVGQRYIAKISVPFDSVTGSLDKYITPCDDNIFSYTALK